MLRLALAQFRPLKGAYDENLCRFGALFREIAGWAEPAELVVAPEAALTGYFLEGGVRDLAVPAERAFDTRWGRAAILICEDAWHSITPMLAALDGAQLIIIPSASPARGVWPAAASTSIESDGAAG